MKGSFTFLELMKLSFAFSRTQESESYLFHRSWKLALPFPTLMKVSFAYSGTDESELGFKRIHESELL